MVKLQACLLTDNNFKILDFVAMDKPRQTRQSTCKIRTAGRFTKSCGCFNNNILSFEKIHIFQNINTDHKSS